MSIQPARCPHTSLLPCSSPIRQGLCPEYDAALQLQQRLAASAASAVDGLRAGLAERGQPPKAVARVKLVEWKGEQLLEVRALGWE